MVEMKTRLQDISTAINKVLCLILSLFIFRFFAGFDVLIQCMSTTKHSLSNLTFCWDNAALLITDALHDEYQWFYGNLNFSHFV